MYLLVVSLGPSGKITIQSLKDWRRFRWNVETRDWESLHWKRCMKEKWFLDKKWCGGWAGHDTHLHQLVDFSHVPMPRAKAKQGSDHCQSICRWKAGDISMFLLKTRDRTNIVWTPFNLSDPPMRSMPVMMLLLAGLATDLVMITMSFQILGLYPLWADGCLVVPFS